MVKANAKNEAAAAAARHAEANLKQAEKSFAAAQKASDDKIAREQSEHVAWLERERAEIETERKAIAKLKATAEVDARKAAELKNEMNRRLRVMEGN